MIKFLFYIIILIATLSMMAACKNRKVAITKEATKASTEVTQTTKVITGSTTEAEQERAVNTNIKATSTGENLETVEFDGGTIEYNATTGETKIATNGKTKFTRSSKEAHSSEKNVADSSKTKSKSSANTDSTGHKQTKQTKVSNSKSKSVAATPNYPVIIGCLLLGVGIIIWQYCRWYKRL
jgi:thiol:disulfide interchange protein